MNALLQQQGLWAPLSVKKVELVTAEMEVIEEKAYSKILLSLADEIIIEVSRVDDVADLWWKLDYTWFYLNYIDLNFV